MYSDVAGKFLIKIIKILITIFLCVRLNGKL